MGLGRQLRATWLVLTLIYVPAALALLVPMYMKVKYGISARLFFNDPIATFNAPIYLGFFSMAGGIAWTTASAACFFAFSILRKRRQGELALFFACSLLLTGVLLVDDLFLIHDRVLPDYLGLSERWMYVVYLGYLPWYLYRFRAVFFTTDYVVLLLALGFLGFSMTLDVFEHIVDLQGHVIVEDGAKFLGILTWAIYFTQSSLACVHESFRKLPGQVDTAKRDWPSDEGLKKASGGTRPALSWSRLVL